MKLVYHQDHTCKVVEEIIEVNPDTLKAYSHVSIVEQAENDLLRLMQIWLDKETRYWR